MAILLFMAHLPFSEESSLKPLLDPRSAINDECTTKEVERPLKDRLLLQGPKRGFFAAEGPHFYTSIFMVCPMNAKVMPK
jgi:hypothetical protein